MAKHWRALGAWLAWSVWASAAFAQATKDTTPQVVTVQQVMPERVIRPQPPSSAFTTAEQIEDVQLSPDGQQLAALVSRNGMRLLLTRKVGDSNWQGLLREDQNGARLDSIEWFDNSRLMLQLSTTLSRPVGGGDRRNFTERRLHMIQIADGKVSPSLTSGSGYGEAQRGNLQNRALRPFPLAGDRIYLPVEERREYGGWGVARVELATLRRKEAVPHTYEVLRVWSNAQGEPQLRVEPGRGALKWSRPNANGRWVTHDNPPALRDPDELLGIDEEGRFLFAQRQSDGRYALMRQAPGETATALTELAYRPHELLRDGASREVVGVRWGGTGTWWINPDWNVLQARLDSASPFLRNEIRQVSGSRYLVRSASAQNPGAWLLGEREAPEPSTKIFIWPELRQLQLPPMQSQALPGAPGVHLRTLWPLDTRTVKDAPVVLCLESCALGRQDHQGLFNPLAAYLASRGAVVAQLSTDWNATLQSRGLLAANEQIGKAVQAWVQHMNSRVDLTRLVLIAPGWHANALLRSGVEPAAVVLVNPQLEPIELLNASKDETSGLASREAAEKLLGKDNDRSKLLAAGATSKLTGFKGSILWLQSAHDGRIARSTPDELQSSLQEANVRFERIDLHASDVDINWPSLRLKAFQGIAALLTKVNAARTSNARSAPSAQQ